jgi:hypothetical protein
VVEDALHAAAAALVIAQVARVGELPLVVVCGAVELALIPGKKAAAVDGLVLVGQARERGGPPTSGKTFRAVLLLRERR